MKKIPALLLVFWIAACGAPPSTISPPSNPPTIADITPAPAQKVSSGQTPSVTPTIFPDVSPTRMPETLIIPTLQMGSPIQLRSTLAPSLEMIDAQIGWAVQLKYPSELRPGYQMEVSYPWQPEGYILRTTDGGKTWQNVTPPTGAYSAGGFFALDANHAWASENVPCCTDITSTRVWSTSDSGKTWQPGQPFTVDPVGVKFFMPKSMQFIDQNTGWLLATVKQDGLTSSDFPTFDHNLLFRTTDGGETWKEINSTSQDLGAGYGVFAFIDSSTGWYSVQAGGRGTFSEYFAGGGWKVRHTTDGGNSFSLDTLIPIPPELQELESTNPVMHCSDHWVIAFAPKVVGIDWGCEISSVGPWFRYFSLTTDAGHTWYTGKAETSEYFFHATHGWRVISPPSPGQLGQLQQTTDGSNWITIKTVAWEYAAFDFISEQEGWAIASRNSIYALVHTTDGGKTWEEIKPVIASR